MFIIFLYKKRRRWHTGCFIFQMSLESFIENCFVLLPRTIAFVKTVTPVGRDCGRSVHY